MSDGGYERCTAYHERCTAYYEGCTVYESCTVNYGSCTANYESCELPRLYCTLTPGLFGKELPKNLSPRAPASYPGRSRRAPQLLNTCRTDAQKSWTICAGSRDSGPNWPSFAKYRPMLTTIDQIVQCSTKTGWCSPNLGRGWPNLTQATCFVKVG